MQFPKNFKQTREMTCEEQYKLLQRHQQHTWRTAGPLEHRAMRVLLDCWVFSISNFAPVPDSWFLHEIKFDLYFLIFEVWGFLCSILSYSEENCHMNLIHFNISTRDSIHVNMKVIISVQKYQNWNRYIKLFSPLPSDFCFVQGMFVIRDSTSRAQKSFSHVFKTS